MTDPLPLLILRPQPGAARTAAAARRLGLDPVIAPLFTVGPVAWEPPDPTRFDALIATSANAFRHGGAGLRALQGLPVRAVGAATADAARAAGFAVTQVGHGSAADLFAEVPPEARLLWLAGRDHLPPAGPAIPTVIVYAADRVPLSDAATRALAGGAVAALHSPRAASALREETGRLQTERAKVAVAALSQAVAQAAGGGWLRVAVASRPQDAALLSVAASLCKTGA